MATDTSTTRQTHPTHLTLHETRLERTLGIRELARASGVSESTIYLIEHGGSQPRMTTIRKLAAALGVGPRDIAWPGDPFGSIR